MAIVIRDSRRDRPMPLLILPILLRVQPCILLPILYSS